MFWKRSDWSNWNIHEIDKVTPEDVFLGSEPPTRLDFQSCYPTPPPSREIFQHAFCRGGVDFFWNNPILLLWCIQDRN